MCRLLAVVLAAAAFLAAPQHASAKGLTAASVCGLDDCHPVAEAAARAGFEDVTPTRTPARAEAFLTIHLRARVASGRVAEVYRLDWLPGAGVMRGYRERGWTRPGPALDRALRRAAHGLRPRPPNELAPLNDHPQARVDEVYAPAREDGPRPPIVAATAALTLLAAFAIGRAHKRPAASPR